MKSQYTKICERYIQAKKEYLNAFASNNKELCISLQTEIKQLHKTLNRIDELALNGWTKAYTGNYPKAEIYARLTLNEAWTKFIELLAQALYLDKILNWINKKLK